MDPTRFDRLAVSIGARTTRRAALGMLAALGLTGLRHEAVSAAGCRPPGKPCAHRGQCCSGVCRHNTCRAAPGQGTCTTAQNGCAASGGTCNGDASCECWVTSKGASFCGQEFPFTCQLCKKNADCVAAGFPAGSICLKVEGGCGGCDGFSEHRACVKPCPTPAP